MDKVAMTKAYEKMEISIGWDGSPKETFLLLCVYVVLEGWKGEQAGENAPEIMPHELGFERTQVRREGLGKKFQAKERRIWVTYWGLKNHDASREIPFLKKLTLL